MGEFCCFVILNTHSCDFNLSSKFQVAYQKILQLSYIDKFLSDIQMEFRDKYKDDLHQGKIARDFTDFDSDFKRILRETETAFKQQAKIPK